MSAGEYFKVRVGVVLLKDDKLLLCRQNNRDFWVLPGGTQEPDEGMADCAVREMKEEANLDVRVEKLLYIADFLHPKRHVIDTFFLATYLGGDLVMETTENLNAINFFPYEEAVSLMIEPDRVFQQLMRDWKNDNFSRASGCYLGKYGP